MRAGPLLSLGACALALAGCGEEATVPARAPAAAAPADPVALASYRRWVSERYLGLQEATIALQDAAEARDLPRARAAWSRADALVARVGIAPGDPVATDLLSIAADLGSGAITARTARAARDANDDAARARRTRLNAPMSDAALAAEPRRILDLASRELLAAAVSEQDLVALGRSAPGRSDARRDPAVASVLAALQGARERLPAPAPASLVRAERAAQAAAASLDAAERRSLTAALDAALDDFARRERR